MRAAGGRPKDSTGDPARLAVELDQMGGGVYTGSAALVLQAGAMGASGAILALANVDLDGCARAWAGDGPASGSWSTATVPVR